MMFIYFDVFCPSQNKSGMSGQYRIDGVQTHFISALNPCIRREDGSANFVDHISGCNSFIVYVKSLMRHKLVAARSCLHCLQYVCKSRVFEPRHDISNNVVYAISKASDQPAHTRSLITAFASRLNIL